MFEQKSLVSLFSLAVGTVAITIVPWQMKQVNALNDNFATNLLAQAKNPYDGKGYTATAYFKCSVNNASHNQQCPGGITRQNNHSATVTVVFPNRKEVTYTFKNCPYDDLKNCKITSNAGGKLDWGRQGDEWFIGIDNKLFVIIVDAAIYGG
jgi:hypothetical protein